MPRARQNSNSCFPFNRLRESFCSQQSPMLLSRISRNPFKSLSSLFHSSIVVMNSREVIEQLSQLTHQLRRDVESTKSAAEKERLVLKHIKTLAAENNCINDFQKGKKGRFFGFSFPRLNFSFTAVFFSFCRSFDSGADKFLGYNCF